MQRGEQVRHETILAARGDIHEARHWYRCTARQMRYLKRCARRTARRLSRMAVL